MLRHQMEHLLLAKLEMLVIFLTGVTNAMTINRQVQTLETTGNQYNTTRLRCVSHQAASRAVSTH